MKHRDRRTSIVMIGIVALVAVLVVTAVSWATAVAGAANTGKIEAETGIERLTSMDATGAAQHFAAAKNAFSRAQRMLGPDRVGATVRAIPLIGHQYSTAQALVAIGIDGSTAGTELAAMLQEAPAVQTGALPPSTLRKLLESKRRHIDAALVALIDAADRASKLDERGLLPPMASAVRSLKTALGDAGPFLARFRSLLPLESYFLSATRRILVVSEDGAELRPTGGFAGSYGVIEVGPMGVRLDEYRDVSVLPYPRVRVAPPPGANFRDFSFRDANWWIDFPTSARSMLGFWREAGQAPVDGIIVVDTVAMKDLLGALGPVRVPSFSETFTSENLLERLLFYTQVKGAGRTDRKDVLVALATQLQARVVSSSPGDLAKAALALAKAADAKHMQLYFTDPGAQAGVVGLGWSGRISAPVGTTDILVVTNMMNLGSKVNVAMKKTIDYEVVLKPDRSADTTLVLGYSNTGPYTLPTPIFRDWLRVSRARGTVFAPGAGGYTTEEVGLPTEVRLFSVGQGQTRTRTLVSHVPGALDGGSHYRLFIVRQADLEDVPTSVRITPPPGSRMSKVSARLAASGVTLPTTTEGGRARLSVPLTGDLIIDVWLARP